MTAFVCGCISLCLSLYQSLSGVVGDGVRVRLYQSLSGVVGDGVRVRLYQSLSGVVGDGVRVWLYQPAPPHHRVGEHQLAGGGRVPPGPVAGV